MLALDDEKWTEAGKYFEQAVSLARIVGRDDLLAQSEYGLSRVHEAEERSDLALPLAQDALKIYERLQHQGFSGGAGVGGEVEEGGVTLTPALSRSQKP
jgi:hypothetical protein